MRAVGVGLIFLPLILFILCGLIFDTADMLTALVVLGVLVGPMFAGFYLLERFSK